MWKPRDLQCSLKYRAFNVCLAYVRLVSHPNYAAQVGSPGEGHPWMSQTWINSGISITGHVPLTVPGYLHHHLCSATIWSCSDVKSACLHPRLGGGHPKEGSNIFILAASFFYRTIEVFDLKSRKCGS
jgi:hypothetical protein